jgi:hypothetical protein
MSWMNIADVMGGFGGRSREIRDEETRRADRAYELERRTLEYLATSDDPEIRTAAVTGILSSSQPKKKGGLGGWYGEVESHPAYANIYRILNTPVTKTREREFATPEGGRPMHQMGTAGSAGQMVENPEFGGDSRMAALTGGGPSPDMATSDGPAPLQAGRPPRPPRPQGPASSGFQAMSEAMPPAESGPPPARQTTPSSVPHDVGTYEESYQAPREVFYSPEEKLRRQASAQYGGRLEGIIEGGRKYGVKYTPAEIQEIARGLSGAPQRRAKMLPKFVKFRDGTTGYVSVNDSTGELEDGNGNVVNADDIVAELPRNASAGTRSYKSTIDTPQGPQVVITTVDGQGNVLAQKPVGEAIETQGTVTIPGQGTYSIDKRGAKGTKVADVPPAPVRTGNTGGPKLDPFTKERVRVIEAHLNQIEAIAKQEGKLGGMFDPDAAQIAREREARAKGYASYKDLLDKLRAVQEQLTTPGGVTPPPRVADPGDGSAPAAPQAGGGFGTPGGADAIRKFLPPRQ